MPAIKSTPNFFFKIFVIISNQTGINPRNKIVFSTIEAKSFFLKTKVRTTDKVIAATKISAAINLKLIFLLSLTKLVT